MNIFVAGGGRVGFHLARLLSTEEHDVTVIETDPLRVEQIDYQLDARTIAGQAQDVLLLKSLGVGESDLFLAMTGDDEVNLIAATTAKGLGAKQVVARVYGTVYNQSDILYETIMGIDYILSPQALTAHEIANYIENPGTVAAESFGRGLIQMLQVRVTHLPEGDEQAIRDITLPSGVLLGLIGRNGTVEIPSGGSKLRRGDVVTLIGRKEQVAQTKKLFRAVEIKHDDIVIMGGSRTGLQLAEALENRNLRVKLLEYNEDRCKELAALLHHTKVVNRDATSRLSLEQEHVDEADMFVAVTHDDERNIMASVLAKEVGAKSAIAVIHQPDFAPLVGKLGINHAVTPRACLANRVLKLVSQDHTRALAVLEDGQVEIIEFEVLPGSKVAGNRLVDIRFPAECLVASIVRGSSVVVPRGGDALDPGDTVVVIAATRSVSPLQKLFQE